MVIQTLFLIHEQKLRFLLDLKIKNAIFIDINKDLIFCNDAIKKTTFAIEICKI